MNILLVEDEKNLGLTLTEYLQGLGHRCVWASTAAEAQGRFGTESFTVVLMDVGLPDGDGLELAKRFKEQSPELALLFLSAQNDPALRVEGLEVGAFDYITKPFQLKELLLRLQRLSLQGIPESTPDLIERGPSRIHFRNHYILCYGKRTKLSARECGLLKKLYRERNQVVAREELMNQLWSPQENPSPRALDNYMVKLRRALEADPDWQFISLRGIGYQLQLADDPSGPSPGPKNAQKKG